MSPTAAHLFVLIFIASAALVFAGAFFTGPAYARAPGRIRAWAWVIVALGVAALGLAVVGLVLLALQPA